MQNFGNIKYIFNTILVEGIVSKDKRKKAIFKEFVRAINESKILKTQFKIYFNIEKKADPDEFKSSEFVKESVSLLNKFSNKDIIKENQKLISILEKHNIETNVSDYDKKTLHENINNLIFTKKTTSNIDTIIESVSMVSKYIQNNIITEKQEKSLFPNSLLLRSFTDKFNDKYKDLTNEEKETFKAIIYTDSADKETVFKSNVQECLNNINDKLSLVEDDTEKSKMLNVKEALLNMSYNEQNFSHDMGKLIKLKTALNA